MNERRCLSHSGDIQSRLGLLTAILIALSAGGCGIGDIKRWWNPPPPVETCVFTQNPTKDEVVAFINNRSSKLAAWQCSDASITSSSLPFDLSAHIAVQRAKNFRMVISSPMGNEADFGSNSERVWFWMRRDPAKKILTVRHDQLDKIEGRMPIPFRPDWLMEALGVIPLDPQNVRMLPRQPGDKMLRLLSREYTPAGQIVQRVIVVDACNGNVVSQSLEDTNGRMLMSAEFNGFQTERHSGLKMPYRIELKWPQAKMSMSIRLNTVQVNPKEFAPRTWQLPEYVGCRPLDLAKQFAGTPRASANGNRQTRYDDRNRGRIRIQPLANERPKFDDEQGAVRPLEPYRPAPNVVTPIGGQQTPVNDPGPFARPFPGTRTMDRPHFADE